MRRVCVFCGSYDGARAAYREAAQRMGAALARRGLTLVYGGGSTGLMGALADAALDHGGRVIGVVPAGLFPDDIVHHGLSELRLVGSMHERKALMAQLADAFVALPGGMGTLEELCEALTWRQIGLHRKPCGLLNVDRFYDPLLAMLDHTVGEGFIKLEHRMSILVEDDPNLLLDQFGA
jgi:uncharacterized protein (TIGR00730 family)